MKTVVLVDRIIITANASFVVMGEAIKNVSSIKSCYMQDGAMILETANTVYKAIA